MHFKVAACGRLLQAQAGMHISFKLDEQANHSAGALLKNCGKKWLVPRIFSFGWKLWRIFQRDFHTSRMILGLGRSAIFLRIDFTQEYFSLYCGAVIRLRII